MITSIFHLTKNFIWNLIDSLLILSHLFPKPLLEGSFYWQISYCIEVAIKIGLFDAISINPKSISNIADEINVDVTALTLLINVLETVGYVQVQSSGQIKITRMSKKWLTNQYGSNLQINVLATKNLRQRWELLESTVKYGFHGEDTYSYFANHPEEAITWHLALAQLAKQIAPIISGKVKFDNSPKSLLDLGGSHGLYAAEFCKKFSTLKATVFDQESGIKVGIDVITTECLLDRFSFVTGNFWLDELGGPYDVILVFNILHANSIEQNIMLMKKCKKSLNAGGCIIILEQFFADIGSHLGNLTSSLISLNLFNETGGRIWEQNEIIQILEQSGLDIVAKFTLLRVPGNAVFVAKHNKQ